MWEAGGYVAESIVHFTRARSDRRLGGLVIPREVFERVTEGNPGGESMQELAGMLQQVEAKPGYFLETNTLRRLSST
jgi:hypothetical protein